MSLEIIATAFREREGLEEATVSDTQCLVVRKIHKCWGFAVFSKVCLCYLQSKKIVFNYSDWNMTRKTIWESHNVLFWELWVVKSIVSLHLFDNIKSERWRSSLIRSLKWGSNLYFFLALHNLHHPIAALMKHLVILWCPHAKSLSLTTSQIDIWLTSSPAANLSFLKMLLFFVCKNSPFEKPEFCWED